MEFQVDSNKDNIKGKIVISSKYINMKEEFKVKFILSKEILKYEEDLIAFVELIYKDEKKNAVSPFLSSTACQINIPLKDYKEYDEKNISYEIDLCVPDYNGYFEHISVSVQPRLNFRGFAPFTEDKYEKKKCYAGIMRESQLKEPRFAKVIKRKKIVMRNEKSVAFRIFTTLLTLLIYTACIFNSNYILETLPYSYNINAIITVIILVPIFLIVPKVINLIFYRKDKKPFI